MNPVAEIAPNGTVRAVNTFGPNGLISRREGSVSTTYSFDPRGGTVHRHAETGAVISSHSYEAYGFENPNTTNSNHAWWADPWVNYAAQNGVYRDNAAGLLLQGFRFYDSRRGRFLNRDPIGYAGGINLYQFAKSNPVQYGDALGLSPSENWETGHKYSSVDTDFAGGFFDGATFGISPTIAYKINPDAANYFDHSSLAYASGQLSSIVVPTPLAIASLVTRAGKFVATTIKGQMALRKARPIAVSVESDIWGRVMQLRASKEVRLASEDGHHVFPQAMKEFFSSKGINVDDFILNMDRATHRKWHGNHRAQHHYNVVWRRWREEFGDNATHEQVIEQGKKILSEFERMYP